MADRKRNPDTAAIEIDNLHAGPESKKSDRSRKDVFDPSDDSFVEYGNIVNPVKPEYRHQ